MIHKVKPPTTLKLVQGSKQTKNDLGGQSGEAYSKDQRPKEQAKQSSPSQPIAHNIEEPESKSVSAEQQTEQQVGLTQVIKDWKEAGKATGSISPYKMSLKYQGESAPAKGMLLNKKIS